MSECIEWQGARTPRGYGQRRVEGKTYYAHRLAFEERYGYLPEVVRHACDNPPCCNPEHLIAGTQHDNVQDMIDRDRMATGERAGNSRLTEAQAREIVEAVASGAKQVDMARKFGMSKQAINAIIKGRSWKMLAEKTESTGH